MPHHPHVPLSQSIVHAIASVCFTLGWEWTAALILIGHHCLLRPGEIMTLHRHNMHLPCDSPAKVSSAVISIVRPKTRNRGRMLEAVTVEWPALVLLLNTLFGWIHPDTNLCRGGRAGLVKRFEYAKSLLSLQTAPFTLASLRSGGAVDFYRSTGNVAALQFRGRWDSPSTLNHYLQEAMATLAFGRLSKQSFDKVEALADLLPAFTEACCAAQTP